MRSTCPDRVPPLPSVVRRRAGRAEVAVGAAGGRRRAGQGGVSQGGEGLASGRGRADPAGRPRRRRPLAKHAAAAKKEEAARTALAAAEAAVAARRETAKALADAAGRAQEVVKKLPKEKDLADAARVFANRSAAAATELAALEKASGEKAAALKKIGEERAAVDRIVEAARAKFAAGPRVGPPRGGGRPGGPPQAGRRPDVASRTTSVASPHSKRTPDGTDFANGSTPIDARPRALRPALAEAEKRAAEQFGHRANPGGRGEGRRTRRGWRPKRPARTPRRRSNAIGRPRPAWTRHSPPPGPRRPSCPGMRPWPRPPRSSRGSPTSCRRGLRRLEARGRRGPVRPATGRRISARAADRVAQGGGRRACAAGSRTSAAAQDRIAAGEVPRRCSPDRAGRGDRRPDRACWGAGSRWPSSSRCRPSRCAGAC